MLRQALVAVILFGCGSSALIAWAASPKKKRTGKVDAGSSAVERTLRAELAGPVDRREQLAETLTQHPESPSARWQSGFVKEGSSWRSFDAPASSADVAEFDAYRKRRDDAPKTYDGQLELANWCGKNGLPDQEYAHVFAALELAPAQNNPELLARLGYRQIGGVWLSREDIRDWHRLNQAIVASLANWEAKLNRILEGLSGTVRQRDLALAALKEIRDPGAIPAIELVLAGQSEEVAQLAVGQMQRTDAPAASLALAKQAVFSQWPEVRKTATAALKSRTLEEFVPSLIALLATPVKADARVALVAREDSLSGALPDSVHIVLLVSYVLHRETADQFQIATFRTANYQINEIARGTVLYDWQIESGNINNLMTQSVILGRHHAQRTSALEMAARERTVGEVNELTLDLNRRIGTVLAQVSDLPEADPSDPKPWWQWWDKFTDSPRLGEKAIVSETVDTVIGNPAYGLRHVSCFAATTPVWTDRGPVAIEKIAVGDRVLSQDIETGVLAYRPVLKTTVRPPGQLTSLRFTDETIACTSGHLFWSSGEGWTKARDLASQTLLHTVTGNTPVWSIQKGETGTAHNLVVADFHTYFVGKTGMLSQDLLAPKRMNVVVPGLARK